MQDKNQEAELYFLKQAQACHTSPPEVRLVTYWWEGEYFVIIYVRKYSPNQVLGNIKYTFGHVSTLANEYYELFEPPVYNDLPPLYGIRWTGWGGYLPQKFPAGIADLILQARAAGFEPGSSLWVLEKPSESSS